MPTTRGRSTGLRLPDCARISRAYLHHLVKAGEILAAMLLTWHNLFHYQDLMAGLRTRDRAGPARALGRRQAARRRGRPRAVAGPPAP